MKCSEVKSTILCLGMQSFPKCLYICNSKLHLTADFLQNPVTCSILLHLSKVMKVFASLSFHVAFLIRFPTVAEEKEIFLITSTLYSHIKPYIQRLCLHYITQFLRYINIYCICINITRDPLIPAPNQHLRACQTLRFFLAPTFVLLS